MSVLLFFVMLTGKGELTEESISVSMDIFTSIIGGSCYSHLESEPADRNSLPLSLSFSFPTSVSVPLYHFLSLFVPPSVVNLPLKIF